MLMEQMVRQHKRNFVNNYEDIRTTLMEFKELMGNV